MHLVPTEKAIRFQVISKRIETGHTIFPIFTVPCGEQAGNIFKCKHLRPVSPQNLTISLIQPVLRSA